MHRVTHIYTTIIGAGLLASCSTPSAEPIKAVSELQRGQAEPPQSGTEKYREQAEELMQSIASGQPQEELLEQANSLTSTGLQLLQSLKTQHPVCGEYLDAIASVGPSLYRLPLAEIESGYHADGKLPEMPNPACYHGKDLVVHPATVAAMARIGLTSEAERAAATAEIAEVLTHLSAVNPTTEATSNHP